MAKAGHFDICKRMAQAGQDIRLSTLDNITNLTFQKRTKGTLVTIGVDGDLVADLGLHHKFIGGLLLCDQDQYFAMKTLIESEPESTESSK